jgi:hypothetical protein
MPSKASTTTSNVTRLKGCMPNVDRPTGRFGGCDCDRTSVARGRAAATSKVLNIDVDAGPRISRSGLVPERIS